MSDMSVGESIRMRRIELHMTQQDLADALGYKTRSSIAKIEKSLVNLTQDKLLSLANTLQTSVNALLNNESNDQISHRASVVTDSDYSNHEVSQTARKCIAVILAGGKTRINKYSIPFQFITVKGKPVVLYTMENFQYHPQISEIHVVCLEGWEDYLPAYAKQYGITKLKSIIPAGPTGIQSVKNAVERLAPSHSAKDILIIQEATRPFIDPETISNAISICKAHGNAVVFERMDQVTPFLLNNNDSELSYLPASRLINIQSPEVYSFGALRQAFHKAAVINHHLDETICAVFMHHMGYELKLCEGSHSNFRIVYEEDLKLLNALV